MTFTDDDLKRLKERFMEADDAECDYMDMKVLLQKALLARLECAEALCEEWAQNANTSHPCSMNTLYEAWRKAKGE